MNVRDDVTPVPAVRPFQPGLDWCLPNWLNRIAKLMAKVGSYVASLLMLVGCMLSLEALGRSAPLGLLLAIPVAYLTIAIHESGHYLAARIMGMTVPSVQIGPFQAMVDNRRWRWRKVDRIRGIDGYVIAYPHPYTSVRHQRLVIAAGGPLANLFLALLSGLIGYLLLAWSIGIPSESVFDGVFGAQRPTHPLATVCGALLLIVAGYNVAIGLINLLPKQGALPSDGLNIIRWLYRVRDDEPQLAFQRLLGMCYAGVTVDRLPADLLVMLAGQPQPMPLFHLWFTLCAKQMRGEWNEAAALLEPYITMIGTMPPDMVKSLADSIAALRAEIDFSRAMAGEQLSYPLDQALTKNLDFTAPSLRPSLQALHAALAGDAVRMEAKLVEASDWVKRSIDRSLQAGHARTEVAIRSRLASIGPELDSAIS